VSRTLQILNYCKGGYVIQNGRFIILREFDKSFGLEIKNKLASLYGKIKIV
jgi:hypothetical protein